MKKRRNNKGKLLEFYGEIVANISLRKDGDIHAYSISYILCLCNNDKNGLF